MIPVKQTTFGADLAVPDAGNCVQAAVASLLELPLSAVPHIAHEAHVAGRSWFDVLGDWLGDLGYGLVLTGGQIPPPVWHLVVGPSPRGDWDHIVVAFGEELRHDPHPDGTMVNGQYRVFLLPIDPARALPLYADARRRGTR